MPSSTVAAHHSTHWTDDRREMEPGRVRKKIKTAMKVFEKKRECQKKKEEIRKYCSKE